MKRTLYHLILAASLPVIVQTVSAQTTLLTDNFTSISPGDVNNELGAGQTRQTGTQAVSGYTDAGVGGGNQTGNYGTMVGQPGGASDGAYCLMYNGDALYNNLVLNNSLLGGHALSISFNIYQGTYNGQPATDWTSFSIETPGSTPNPNNSAGFGYLIRANGGLQVFDNGSSVGSFDTPGYITSDAWTVVFSGDAAGTTTPFGGTTYVQLYNNNDPANSMTGLGLVYSGQLSTALADGDQIGWHNLDPGFNENGIANLDIVTVVPEPSTYALLGAGLLSLLAFRRRLSA
jgi:uncharacterized membrane protein